MLIITVVSHLIIPIYNSMEKVHPGAVTVVDEEISEIETDVVMAVEVGVLETEIETVIVVTEAVVRDLMEVMAGKNVDARLVKANVKIFLSYYVQT